MGQDGGRGVKIKITLFHGGGGNFPFMSCACNCKNNSTCIVKQEIYSRCSMYLEIVKSVKKMPSHFDVTSFFSRCKRIV